jgi:hypothetical protein
LVVPSHISSIPPNNHRCRVLPAPIDLIVADGGLGFAAKREVFLPTGEGGP